MNKNRTNLKYWAPLLIVALATVSLLVLSPVKILAAEQAEAAPPPSEPAKRSTAALEKLVEPIALHPDPLIAVILPASVYPLEIVQAARFVKDTNNIAKVDEQNWDTNVKELAKFPDMIAKMDADLDWTSQLGEAFIDQPKELMDAIQSLRGKAQKGGTLQTTEQQIVTVTNIVVMQTNVTEITTVTNQIVQVAPANPQVVYVPSYPPTVYYPPPGYVYNPIAPLVSFGVGMAWGAVLANNCNWGHGSVDVDIDRDVNRSSERNVNRDTSRSGNRTSTSSSQKQWKPDQNRMRNSGSTQARTTASNQARGWGGSGSGSTRPSTGTAASRPTTGTAANRPSTGTAANRPSTGTAANRPSTGSAGSRPSTGNAPANRPAPSSSSVGNRSSGSSAFSGSSSGGAARSQSSRGAASRGGGGGSRGGGGGRR